MHKIYEYLCDEMKGLEKKVESGQGLSMSEIEYLDKLTETKKNLLKIDMLEEDSNYSNSMGGSYRGSYARGRVGNVKRDAMGRYSSTGYSRAEDDFMADLEELMRKAPDDNKRQKIQRLLSEM